MNLELGIRTRRRPIGRDYGAARMGNSKGGSWNSEGGMRKSEWGKEKLESSKQKRLEDRYATKLESWVAMRPVDGAAASIDIRQSSFDIRHS